MKTSPKVETLQLVERLCAGGCGKTFRCLPASPAQHCSSWLERAEPGERRRVLAAATAFYADQGDTP